MQKITIARGHPQYADGRHRLHVLETKQKPTKRTHDTQVASHVDIGQNIDQRRAITEGNRKFELLNLPPELREIIYWHVANSATWLIHKDFRETGRKIRGIRVAPPLRQAHDRPQTHPLSQTCKLMHQEFEYFLRSLVQRKALFGDPRLEVHVRDFDFRPLILQLRRNPPNLQPCILTIHLNFSEPGKEDWKSLYLWLRFLKDGVSTQQQPSSPPLVRVRPLYRHCAYPIDINEDGASRLEAMSQQFRHWVAGAPPQDRQLYVQCMEPLVFSFFTWIWRLLFPKDSRDERPRFYDKRMPKRMKAPLERQTKRQRTGDEGEWKVGEGFGVHGEADEDYMAALDGMARLTL